MILAISKLCIRLYSEAATVTQVNSKEIMYVFSFFSKFPMLVLTVNPLPSIQKCILLSVFEFPPTLRLYRLQKQWCISFMYFYVYPSSAATKEWSQHLSGWGFMRTVGRRSSNYPFAREDDVTSLHWALPYSNITRTTNTATTLTTTTITMAR